jgi:hypothetical protein
MTICWISFTRLNIVWFLYFVYKHYSLNFLCSAEVWRVVSSVQCVQCFLKTSTLRKYAFATTLAHKTSKIVRIVG